MPAPKMHLKHKAKPPKANRAPARSAGRQPWVPAQPDSERRDILAGLDRLLAEMPPEGPRVRTHLARTLIQDRE